MSLRYPWMVLAVVVSGLCPVVALGFEAAKAEIVESDIYYGDPSDFRSPAIVDVDAVYAKIPEYQEIIERGMDDTDPRYLFLLRAASDKFMRAIESVARQKGYDLIGGLGSIEIEGRQVPEITGLVIRNLPR